MLNFLGLIAFSTFITVFGGALEARINDGNVRKPFAFAVSGGGFATMTAGMGFARAITEAFNDDAVSHNSAWKNVTHLAGNSGGQWFQVQFAYSESFNEQLTKKNIIKYPLTKGYKPLATVMRDWAKGYSANVENHEQFNPFYKCYVNISGRKYDFGDFAKLLDDLALVDGSLGVAVDWRSFIFDMMRGAIPNIDELTYEDERPAMPDAALIQQMSLTPDVWVNVPDGAPIGTNNQRIQIPANFNTGSHRNETAIVPFAHVVDPVSSTKNRANSFYAPFYTHDRERGNLTLVSEKVDGHGNTSEFIARFATRNETKVGDITAISSAAAGALGSPTLTKGLLMTLGRKLLPDLGENILKDVADDLVDCLPIGLEGLAPAFHLDVVAPEEPWKPPYRAIDGGYTDNAAMAMTIANFIADCENGFQPLDCSAKTLDIILVNINSAEEGIQCFFRDSPNCSPVGEMMQARLLIVPIEGVSTPSREIFEESYPSEWAPYAHEEGIFDADTVASTEALTPEQRRFLDAEKSKLDGYSVPSYHSGTFTTIDNPAYGVKKGYKVRALIFMMNLPLNVDPIILPPVPKFSWLLSLKFEHVYGPIASAQAKGAQPLISKWLRREI